jgi:hypothetical protein
MPFLEGRETGFGNIDFYLCGDDMKKVAKRK